MIIRGRITSGDADPKEVVLARDDVHHFSVAFTWEALDRSERDLDHEPDKVRIREAAQSGVIA